MQATMQMSNDAVYGISLLTLHPRGRSHDAYKTAIASCPTPCCKCKSFVHVPSVAQGVSITPPRPPDQPTAGDCLFICIRLTFIVMDCASYFCSLGFQCAWTSTRTKLLGVSISTMPETMMDPRGG